MDENDLYVNDSFENFYLQITAILQSKGVPASRMPTKAHLLSQLICCIDLEKIGNWITKYAELESVQIDIDKLLEQ